MGCGFAGAQQARQIAQLLKVMTTPSRQKANINAQIPCFANVQVQEDIFGVLRFVTANTCQI